MSFGHKKRKLEKNSNELKSYEFISWILHESEVFIGKAPEGDDVVAYFELSVTQPMETSGSPDG